MKLFWGEADFNLILERILDSKYFSSNSKSLLFSTVYKIESFYEDYKTVKAIDKTKEEFLHEILEDIKKYCDNIRLIEPDSESAKILKDNNVLALTNEKERSLLAYPTETSILYAISDVIPKYFYIPDSFSYKNALQQLLVNGYNENNLEVLSDFNGWSWDINLKVKRNLQDSLIFQNILILLGLHFLEDWMNETEKNSNKLAKLKKTFANTKYFDYLCKYLLLNLPPKDKVKIDKKIEEKENELKTISDKPKYFELVKKNKMKYLKEVEKIDLLLNNKTLLRKEYMKKNLRLSSDKKIATVGTYKKMLEERRQKCIEKISYLSNAINPINYINHKRELEEYINIHLNLNFNCDELIINLQKEFIKALKDLVFETEDIDELKKFIYKIRYYRFLYVNDEKQVRDISDLDVGVNVVLKQIIKRLSDEEELRKICFNDEYNNEIVSNILDTKIIDLKDIKFELSLSNEIYKITIYDKEVYEKDFLLRPEIQKKDLEVKVGKKYKLFI